MDDNGMEVKIIDAHTTILFREHPLTKPIAPAFSQASRRDNAVFSPIGRNEAQFPSKRTAIASRNILFFIPNSHHFTLIRRWIALHKVDNNPAGSGPLSSRKMSGPDSSCCLPLFFAERQSASRHQSRTGPPLNAVEQLVPAAQRHKRFAIRFCPNRIIRRGRHERLAKCRPFLPRLIGKWGIVTGNYVAFDRRFCSHGPTNRADLEISTPARKRPPLQNSGGIGKSPSAGKQRRCRRSVPDFRRHAHKPISDPQPDRRA